MKFIVDMVTKIDSKFDKVYIEFVTKDIHNLEIESLKKQIDSVQDELDDYKEQQREEKKSNKNNLPIWLGILPSTVAVIVAIIAIYK